MKKVLPPVALLFALGIAGGWWWDRPSPDPSAAGEPARVTSRMTRSQSVRASAAFPADVAAHLAAVNAAPDAAERLRAVIQLAWELPVSDFARWYERNGYGLKDGAELGAFYDITRRRWLEEDPEGLMERALVKNWTSFNDIAIRWARLDPDRALEFLRNQRDPQTLGRLRTALLPGLAESRPDEALAVIGSMDRDSRHQWGPVLVKLAEYHPDKLAAAMAEWPTSRRGPAEQALAGARLLRDFPGELDRLAGSPGGKALWQEMLQDHHLASRLGESILSNLDRIPSEWLDLLCRTPWQVTQQNPERWLEVDLEELGVDAEAARNLHRSALSQLSHREPEKTLAHLAGVDLTDNNYQQPFRQAVMALAVKDRPAAQQWLAQLPPEAAEFRDSLSQALVDQANPSEPAEKVAKLLASFQDASAERQVALNAASILTNATPAERAKFLHEFRQLPPGEQAVIGQAISTNGSLNRISRLPFDIGAELVAAAIVHPVPPGQDPAAAERQQTRVNGEASDFAVRWVLEDPAAATRWLADLPDGEPRQWALRNVAVNWRDYDAPAADAWLSSLPPAKRTDVRTYLESQR